MSAGGGHCALFGAVTSDDDVNREGKREREERGRELY